MPVISFVSPKGGAGKTTTAVLLACELANQGASVLIIDADPNGNVHEWSQLPEFPENLEVIAGVTEDNIMEKIEENESSKNFVIIDLEGTASLMVGYAISYSDFVILPTQGSHLDARQATKAIKLIKSQEKANRRTIPHAIVFTRTSAAIKTKTLSFIKEQLLQANIDLFNTQIIDREAYRAIFSYGGNLNSLKKHNVKNVDIARDNILEFTKELIFKMKKQYKEENAA